MRTITKVVIGVGLLLAGGSTLVCAAGEDMQKEIEGIKGALPKFAIPMREVGDRFQDMYFAAEGGNWGLAAYMSKYMHNAMNPAKVTKPKEYADWESFYNGEIVKVNKTIADQNLKAFKKEYKAIIASCNNCHEGMGYGFIKVVKQQSPPDKGIQYKLSSKATDVPK
jgi:hypothetical protein